MTALTEIVRARRPNRAYVNRRPVDDGYNRPSTKVRKRLTNLIAQACMATLLSPALGDQTSSILVGDEQTKVDVAAESSSTDGKVDLPRMGTFQDNRPYAKYGITISAQREAGIEAWESMLRRPTNSLIAEDFYGDGSNTWAGMTASSNGVGKPKDWKMANPKRKLLWSIPLTMTGTSLADVAGGLHDTEFRAAAGAIAASQPDAIIRIGWEMNGSWMPWYTKSGEESSYVDAYRRVANIFRAESAEFTFDWCVSFGRQNSDPQSAYPGDDVVDTIGMDVYDFISAHSPIADPEERWKSLILDGEGRGLTWLASFASSKRKKMSMAEWGVGLTDDQASPFYGRYKDDPIFVQLMRSWLVANAQEIAFHVYFDAPPNRIDDGAFPKALRQLTSDFAKPSAN